ncbi:fimbrial protein [Citrobacter sp. JGM124]|uniref:fimbrial protein n=1 Tax=Citrobacter sp. JGM124 TaxID=2799789 RepID=UPI001BA46B6A|nr:fimbrial protein [Citrobacter sp. JGM124]MBS0848530.1 fimbrial protein [Citrobacter sp. JGM124]
MRNILLIMMMFLFSGVSYADYRETFYVSNVNITDYHNQSEGYTFSSHTYHLRSENLTISTNNNNQHINLDGKYADSVMTGKENTIIRTPIPGLGLRISWATDNQSSNSILKYFPFNRTCISPCQLQDLVIVEFIKIGTIKTGTMRRGTELATVNLSQNVTNPEYMKIVLNEDIILKSRSCVLLDTDKYVDLGNFTADELKNIKYSPKYIDFDLTLSCEQDTSVGMSYIGTSVNQNLKNTGTSEGVSILLNDEDNKKVKISLTPTVNNYVSVLANENKPIKLKTAVNVDDRRNIKSGTIEGSLFILLEIN